MTPAETIRAAVKKMREVAAAADTGEAWEADQHYAASWVVDLKPSLGKVSAGFERAGKRLFLPGCDEFEDPRFAQMFKAHAEHVASWHPLVATAVADMLEAEAAQYELYGESAQVFLTGADGGDADPAFTLARAYLGEGP